MEKNYPWAVEAILNLVYLVDQLLKKDSYVSDEVKEVLVPSLLFAVTPYRVYNFPITNQDLLRFSKKIGLLDNILHEDYFASKVEQNKKHFPNKSSFHQVPDIYDNMNGSSSSSDEDDDFPSYSGLGTVAI
ncbi:MAG: hypothetical protein GY821_12050 [Gammaproteobacteria bacterium]|nr:hypothetical protein [Gammaproteobacteria bacterium]